jgi:hypothetical protein
MALKSGIQIPRNPLYRKRDVQLKVSTGVVVRARPPITKTITGPIQATSAAVKKLILPTFAVTVKDKPSVRTVDLLLTEVTSITQASPAPTAQFLGVVAASIQPWYFQPIVLEIAGKSYIGGYANPRLNIAADSDVEQLFLLRQFVNEAFSLARSSLRDYKAELIIGDLTRPAVGIDQKLTGFADDLTITESVEEQYVLDYRFKFTGEISSAANLRRGEEGSKSDLQAAASRTSTAVAPTSR